MSDQTDTPGLPDDAGAPEDAAGLAADALLAAQQAVSNLDAGAVPDVAGEDAAAAALMAAQQAIAAAKAVNTPPISSMPPPMAQPMAPMMGGPAGYAHQAPRGGYAQGPTPQPVALPSFGAIPPAARPEGIDLLSDVNLNVKIELGRTRMLVEDVLRLGEGSVVELDKLAGDPVDVYVNDRHVARGEVLVLNDNFCVRINEIVASVGEGAERARR